MPAGGQPEIVLVSSGHRALDHRVFYKEARTLARRFDRVRVVATHPHDEVVDGVSVTALRPYRSRLERFLIRPLRCYVAAYAPGPRVLILQDAELLLLAPIARLLFRWRIVYDAHEDYPRLILRRTWIPAPLRQVVSSLGVLEKLLAATCDGVMTPTNGLLDRFERPRGVALYNLPTAEFFRAAEEHARPASERKYDVVHLGTLSDERLTFLIEILRRLGQDRPSVRTLLVGVNGPQADRLRRLVPAAQLTIREHVDYDEIAALLGTCRVGVNVHPVLYPHLECALPVKVFEYLAAGCSVVTSYLPELHRRLGKDGVSRIVTVSVPDPARYADEIMRLIEQPDALEVNRAALMLMARERWSWDSEESKLIDFVSEIAGVRT
jgi:glycosyltransferase involved in cell wall biosynthesis